MKSIIRSTILFLFLLMSCGHSHTPQEDALGSGVPETLKFTVYKGNTELFVEFDPFISGQASKIIAHLSVLHETERPLSDARLMVNLVCDDKTVSSSSDSTNTPGIYRLELKPVNEGKASLEFYVESGLSNDTFIIDGLRVFSTAEQALDSLIPPKEADISFTKEQAWRADFSTIITKEEPFMGVIRTSGRLLSSAADIAVISSPADGIILFNGNDIVQGTKVSKGQPLFTVSAGMLTGSNVDIAYRDAKADYERTKADYERLSELVKDKIVSEKEFMNAQSEFEKARSRFESYSSQTSTNGILISSPVHGYISNVRTSVGQYVKTGDPLAVLSAGRKLLLQANVSQRYFDLLPEVTAANFRLVNRNELFNTGMLNGKLITYGKNASPGSSTIPVTFEIENSVGLMAGSVAEIFLQHGPSVNILTVPLGSLVEEQGVFYVFIKTGGESFEKREVHTGLSDGQRIAILSGLKPGERVVDKGAFNIKLSQASSAMPEHGHEH